MTTTVGGRENRKAKMINGMEKKEEKKGMFVRTEFRANIRRIDCVGQILSQVSHPKSNTH